MFILPKSIFFEYCGILFPILFELSETSQWENLDRYQRRMPGFLAERLTGGFLYYLEKYRNLCVHKTLPIIPLFGSCSKIGTQTRVTANLSKYIPGFTRIYSKFLSFQTHVLQRWILFTNILKSINLALARGIRNNHLVVSMYCVR